MIIRYFQSVHDIITSSDIDCSFALVVKELSHHQDVAIFSQL
jgi:hypothetical protein